MSDYMNPDDDPGYVYVDPRTGGQAELTHEDVMTFATAFLNQTSEEVHGEPSPPVPKPAPKPPARPTLNEAFDSFFAERKSQRAGKG